MVEFEIWHNTEDGTSCRTKGSRKGDGVYEKMRSLGWNYSGRRGVFVLPRSYDRPANTGKINFTVMQLREAGYTVGEPEIDNGGALSYAELEQDAATRAEQRADRRNELADKAEATAEAKQQRSDQITEGYAGTPVLVGHHSESRHRRQLEKAQNLAFSALDDQKTAAYHRGRAKAAATETEHRYNAPQIMRRLDGIRAEQRSRLRDLAKAENSPNRSEEWANSLRESIAQGDEQETYWTEQLEKAKASGVKIWSPEDFKPDFKNGGVFVVRGSDILEVVRVNPKSVSVRARPLQHASSVLFAVEGMSWTHTVSYDKVTGKKTRAEVIAACVKAGRPLPPGVNA